MTWKQYCDRPTPAKAHTESTKGLLDQERLYTTVKCSTTSGTVRESENCGLDHWAGMDHWTGLLDCAGRT